MKQTLTLPSLSTRSRFLPRSEYLFRGAKGSRTEAGRLDWEAEYIQGNQTSSNCTRYILNEKHTLKPTASPPRRLK